MTSPISPDMVYHLKNAGDPCLSPDGARLAYTLSWIDPESLESRSRIQVRDMKHGATVEFTGGLRDSAPEFSPDGLALAFLRADEQKRKQVWTMPVDGGEARQLTSAPVGVVDFAWSPDSRRIAYCADVDPAAAEKPEGDAGPGKGDDAPQVTVVRRIRYRYDTQGWRGDAHVHIFLIEASGGPARQLTDGDWDDYAPAWSPDGSRLAFISGRRDDRDVHALTEAYVMPVEGGEPEMWSEGLTGVGALAWSPDGRELLAVGSEASGGMELWQGWLYALQPRRAPRRLTDASFRPYLTFLATSRPPRMRWLPDGGILLLGEARGESFLYQVPDSGGPAQALAGGGSQMSALSLDSAGSRAVVVSSAPGSPGDLQALDPASGVAKALTAYNREYFQEHPPATLEKFALQREGMTVECRLWLPPDFDPARNYPLVLDIHGGPNGAFYDAFNPLQQVLATTGFLVLAVNPRGSSTYGEDFMTAVLDDWGGEDYLDLMAAVDQVCQRPYVDAERLGVHGYSYGGYMTGWVVGHTNRFRAAVVGAPCTDLVGMYGTSDIGVSFGEAQWGGTLMSAREKLVKRSPLTYAEEVETPVLLLHGEADLRCPIAQSEAFFVVLKRLGKEVEFVRFPDCSHLFPRMGHPKMREEYMARALGWFQRHLR